ncbi:hypothetical protein CICLE_v10002992mg [Citrus x clementina]|uniref:Uncharacterized protein n=1 Tax=Citrus clementina TaxID=85681 RepID=V4SBZ6_CITCL|nr:hypothetical protein CICLE_v10002992mg [Citrus x clementina]
MVLLYVKSKSRKIVLDFPGSCKGWKNQYFVVGGNWGRYVELTKGWFKVPTHFSRPGNESFVQVDVEIRIQSNTCFYCSDLEEER